MLIYYFTVIKSQNDYRPGFVILKSGDTINGKIDFRTDISNCKHCFFKKDSLSKAVEYLPEELYAYRFQNSKFYITKKVKTKDGEINTFLECLISGKVTVYYSVQDNNLEEINNGEHYYIEKDSNLTEIYKDVLKTNSEGIPYIFSSYQYKGALKAIFYDYPDIYKDVDKLEFNRKSLTNISKKYHQAVCKDQQCIIYEKPYLKRIYQFGFEVGYEFSTLNYYSYPQSNLAGNLIFKANPKYDFTVGVFGATNLDYDYRYILQINIKYRSQEYTANNVYAEAYPASYKYDVSSVILDLLFKYRFSLSKFKPYVFPGLALGEIVNDQYNFNTSTQVNFGDSNKDKLLLGAFIGVGIEYSFNSKKNIFLYLKYDYIKSSEILEIGGINYSIGFYF
jgi:hypothetical protein